MRTPRPTLVASALVVVSAAAVVASFLVIDGPGEDAVSTARTSSVVQSTSLTKQVSLSGSIESAAVWDVGGDGSAVMRESADTSASSSAGGADVLSIPVKVGSRVKRGQALAYMDDTVETLRVTAAQQALDAALDARDDLSTSSSTTVTSSSSPGGVSGGGASSGGGVTAGTALQSAATTSTRAYAKPDVDATAGAGAKPAGGATPAATPTAPTTDTTDPAATTGDDDATPTKPSAATPTAGTGAGTGAATGGGARGAGGGTSPAATTTTKRESTAAIVARADAAIIAARSALTTAKEGLAATVLRAPTTGIVVTQRLTRGGIAPSGAAITVRSSGVRVTLSVEEGDVIGMSIGDPATVAVAALDASLTGSVESVGAASGGGSGASSVVTYPVTVVVDSRVAGLRDGMSATVNITTASVDEALVVPTTAIHHRSNVTTVRVRDTEGEVRSVTVTTGLETEQGVQILTGDVQAGDTVELPATSASSSTSANARTGGARAGGFGGNGFPGGPPPGAFGG